MQVFALPCYSLTSHRLLAERGFWPPAVLDGNIAYVVADPFSQSAHHIIRQHAASVSC